MRLLSILVLLATFSACSSATRKSDPPPQGPEQSPTAALQSQVEQLNTTVGELTKKIEFLQDKIELSKNETRAAPQPAPTAIKQAPVLRGESVPVKTIQNKNDPEYGYTLDESVQKFKEAFLLFEAANYAEAILQFSTFLKDFEDHALAGAAQFYVGESYLRQNEPKLARDEFQKILVSYDTSSYISEALHKLVELEEQLKRPEKVAEYKQKLSALFPQTAPIDEPPPPTAPLPENTEPENTVNQ